MDTVKVTGIVLSAMPVGDFDKRLVILTKERGKVTAFAKGAKRTKSRFLAGSRPFSFGEFTLYPGRNAYNIEDMKISHYFDELSKDVSHTYYGFYFLELADYFTVEGVNETETLKLLYQSLRALTKEQIPNELVRSVYELRMLVIHGEYPDFFVCRNCGTKERLTVFSFWKESVYCKECEAMVQDKFYFRESVLYTLQYIVSSDIEKLYTFTLSEPVLKDVKYIVSKYRQKKVERKIKSLDILETIISTEQGSVEP